MNLKNYYQIITRMLFTAALLFGIGMKAQNAFLISFPAAPQDLTVCNGSSKLTVQLDAIITSTTGADVTIQLATGVEYVPGSVALVSTIGGLSIADNGGTANAPKFKISPASIASGNRIIFTIDRIATCAARTFSLASGIFTDSVTASIGAQSDTKVTSSYQVIYPDLTFVQPVAQTNAVVGGTYTRTFNIKNGGNGCMSQVYLSIDYPGNGIQQTSLQITAQNGSAIAPITLTPTSTSGTTSYYTIPSADLPGGDLCNNENITITETYKVKVCSAVTNYSAGWGCDPAPANWCQTKTGTGDVTMVGGVPDFSSTGGGFLPGGSMCTYKEYTFTFKSIGSGDPHAAGYYNLILHHSNSGNFTFYGMNSGFDNSPATRYASYSDVTVQGVPVTISWNGSNLADQEMIINLSQITSDPDGPGVGLEDLDGDGQFDDMLGGGTTITIKVRINWYDNPLIVCNNNAGTSQALRYNPAVRPEYTTMCAPSTPILPAQTKLCAGAPYYYTLQGNNHTSIVSPNVAPGTPFTATISWYPNMGYPYTANTRWRLVFELPANFSVAGTGNPTINGVAVPYTQIGNEVTMLTNFSGNKTFAINFQYACGSDGTYNIPYRIELVDDIVAPCEYFKKRVCDSFSVFVQGCPGSGPCPGPITRLPEVRRADNSLGYTDATLTTRVAASSVPANELKHALYLDTVQITTTAIQNGAASNLFAKVKLDKTTNGLDKIKPIDATVEVYRGGTLINTCTLTTWSTGNSTSTVSEFEWDLTGCFVGGIQDQDEVRMVSRYVVSNNDDLPNASYVLASGGKHYFYNKVAGSEVYCSGNWVLDLYLLGIHYQKYTNPGTDFTGCETKDVGTSFYAVYGGALAFTNEIRPGIYFEKFEVKIPDGFVFSRFDIDAHPSYTIGSPKVNLTPASVSGNVYTFVNDGTWPFSKVINGTGGVTPRVYISPACDTPLNQVDYTGYIKAIGQESYYAYNVPNPGISTNTSHPFSGATSYTDIYRNYAVSRGRLISKPSISLTNQSGTIQASKLAESFTVRISSTGTDTAPYIWLSIPTVSGVTVTGVYDGATPIATIPYSGGVWAQLSATGLASGTYKDYKINFTYTTCNSTTFAVNAGWNCTGYPTDPGAYPCTPSTANLTFVPQPASIQINTITQPTGSINLCTPLDYEFRVNSAGTGNTINNKFNINLPAGLSFVPGSLLVEYPVGAGNWQAVSSTTASGITTLDLTTHTAYPAQGLPGTLNDGGNANVRQMGIKFSLTTDCSFTSGSYVILSTDADRTCGLPATGSGSLLNTSTLTVAGADPGYVLSTSITNPLGPISCSANFTLHIKRIVVLSTATGTPATATVTVNYPPGFDILSTTPNCLPTTTYCPTFISSGVDGITGLGYATYSIPAGMQTGDFLEFELTFTPNASITNGNFSSSVTTDDVMAGLSCPSAPGGTCSSVNVRTSSAVYSYTLQCYCYKNAVTSGTALDTKHGITSLGRAGTANGNWPMVRKGAWTALEAKTKGFVVNRLTDAQIAAIPAAQLVEGMMVYNITQDCLQINVDGTATGWKCFSLQTCPDF